MDMKQSRTQVNDGFTYTQEEQDAVLSGYDAHGQFYHDCPVVTADGQVRFSGIDREDMLSMGVLL
jgi:hypothetical protein